MANRSVAAALVVFAACASLSALAAGPSPFVGEWHWSRAESQGAPEEEPPREMVLNITSAERAKVAWTLTVVDDKGERHVQDYSGTGDGKPSAVSGTTDGSTVAFTVTPTSFDSVASSPDGDTDKASCTLSADHKKMTCHGTESDGKGHAAAYVDVYDRK